jgi:hypothetical protein
LGAVREQNFGAVNDPWIEKKWFPNIGRKSPWIRLDAEPCASVETASLVDKFVFGI